MCSPSESGGGQLLRREPVGLAAPRPAAHRPATGCSVPPSSRCPSASRRRPARRPWPAPRSRPSSRDGSRPRSASPSGGAAGWKSSSRAGTLPRAGSPRREASSCRRGPREPLRSPPGKRRAADRSGAGRNFRESDDSPRAGRMIPRIFRQNWETAEISMAEDRGRGDTPRSGRGLRPGRPARGRRRNARRGRRAQPARRRPRPAPLGRQRDPGLRGRPCATPRRGRREERVR